MATTVTTGSKIAILGDFSGFTIVDRVGATIEVIPHIFGASQRPTGTRGLWFMWRTGSAVTNANAFRYSEAK